MGKKDKKVDKAKVEAKKARQNAKQQKLATKRDKKELKSTGENDIEAIISEFRAKELQKTSVSIITCAQPSPRSNFSITALPNNEILMFGGECCDGESTAVFNDVFRWNLEKNEWKKIESMNTPPPRCAHQAIYYKVSLPSSSNLTFANFKCLWLIQKEKVYIFGGNIPAFKKCLK